MIMAMFRHSLALLLLACLALLTGCIRTQPVAIDTTDYQQIQALSANTVVKSNDGINAIRSQALRETALSFAAQASLAWRSQQINRLLDKHQKQLDQIFSFNSLLLPHNVLPPVLSEGRDTLNLDQGRAFRIADRSYKIISQAKLVTAPPTWRDYIKMNYQKPEPPDRSLLPRNGDEDQVWRKYIAKGWHNGLKQANAIYTVNLQRLRRDFNGMLLYRKLLAQNMVGLPYVAQTRLGVTGDGKKINIDDRVVRLTQLPELQPNAKTWNPIVIKGKHHD